MLHRSVFVCISLGLRIFNEDSTTVEWMLIKFVLAFYEDFNFEIMTSRSWFYFFRFSKTDEESFPVLLKAG